jgi:hypothetical protein
MGLEESNEWNNRRVRQALESGEVDVGPDSNLELRYENGEPRIYGGAESTNNDITDLTTQETGADSDEIYRFD